MNPSIASAVILAAGLGTRMKSGTPKVLHEVCGLPLIDYVLAAVKFVAPGRLIVVLGQGHEQVTPLLPEGTEVALQAEQRGTGHAVLSAADLIPDGLLLVVPGDTPLITGQVLSELVTAHRVSGADATVLTMQLPDPSGYGRIIRGQDGLVDRVVEHRDAGLEERTVDEVNTGMYVLPGPRALALLERVGTDNAQGEIYLTDVVAELRRTGGRVAAHLVADPLAALGVNTRVELAEAQAVMRERLLREWMLAGVTVDDPGSTWVEASVELEPDTRLLPFTILRGGTRVGRGSLVGPGTTLVDTLVGRGCSVRQSYCERAIVEDGAIVGPLANLLPGTRIHPDSRPAVVRGGPDTVFAAPVTIDDDATDRVAPAGEADAHGD